MPEEESAEGTQQETGSEHGQAGQNPGYWVLLGEEYPAEERCQCPVNEEVVPLKNRAKCRRNEDPKRPYLRAPLSAVLGGEYPECLHRANLAIEHEDLTDNLAIRQLIERVINFGQSY